MTDSQDQADFSKGYVRAFRRAWENPAFLNLRDASIWQYIFQNAVHEPEGRLVPFNGRKVRLQRGQIITSIRYLAEGFKVSEKVIRRALRGIEEGGLATLQKAHSGTIVSVCKYDVYQPLPAAEGTPKGTARAHQGHTKGTNTNQLNKQKIQEAPAYSDSPEGVQGEERNGHRHAAGWSPKINHPDQLDLISNTALATDYEPPANPAPAVDELADEPAGEPEPELPLTLSVEGEVLPPEAPVPVVFPVPAVIPAAPAKPSNVVRLKPETDPDFRQWYAAYPRHKKPIDAAKAYVEARRRATASELLEGANRCREEAEASGTGKRFVPYPATWLRAGGWMEEAEDLEVNTGGGQGNEQRYNNRRETGPNVNDRVFAAILEGIARQS